MAKESVDQNKYLPAQSEHYEGTPGPKKQTKLARWEDFEAELKGRHTQIVNQLPSNVRPEKFIDTAVSAVKQNPNLLNCTPRSLMNAITKAALDGLMADGREGVITAYGQDAQWNPMVYGLRKRAKEVDGILIDAQPVYSGDHFVWHQGDTPRIEHGPATLGASRGDVIGAYAIFKREDGTILHREVMDKTEIEAVRAVSKAPNSVMWKSFFTEGARKSVIRRGIKSVPVSETLESIVKRDDENFVFHPSEAPVEDGVMTPPRPKQSDFTRPKAEVVDVEETPEPKPEPASKPVTALAQDGRPEPPPVGEMEIPDSLRKPQPEKAAPEPETDPAPEEQESSIAWDKACEMIGNMEKEMANVPDAELADYKSAGRRNIDAVDGLNDDQKDLLRGRFTSVILTEQQKRAKKGKKK